MKAEYINKNDVLELAMHYCPDDDGSCSNIGDIRDLLDEIEALPSLTLPNDIAQEGTEFDVIDTKTGKYADLQKIALKEEWAKGLVYCDMEGFAIEQDGTLILLDECGNCAYPPEGRFKLIWNVGETE